MMKYPSVERIGNEENFCMKDYPDDIIYITEKVDGGNGSFFVDDKGLIHECSRNRDLTAEGNNEKTFIAQRQWFKHHINMSKCQDCGEIYEEM